MASVLIRACARLLDRLPGAAAVAPLPAFPVVETPAPVHIVPAIYGGVAAIYINEDNN